MTKWTFPANTVLGPRQFLLVWADGETNESLAKAPHTNFRLDPTNGWVALVRWSGGAPTPTVLDYLTCRQLAPDRSFGSYPDGEPRQRRLFYYATPGGTNNPASMPVPVTINEFMAGNTKTFADSADGHFEDWFELYNAGSNAVDLTSYTLTDDLTNATKFVIPAGTVIPPRGFLLVWADEETNQNQPGGDLHVNFKLALAGEQIGLFAPDGTLVDRVTFGQQTNDVSMGRFPDGAVPPLAFMETPTPGTANIFTDAIQPAALRLDAITLSDDGALTILWSARTGYSYRVQYTSDLRGVGWLDLDSPLIVDGGTASVTDRRSRDVQMFYRLLRLDSP